ncbi:beta-phosphoglucomutase family hydrolase [Rudaeicoccus suwonensis]|uniref:Beta-phosphoglucomutase n=1 Tax=Rudaeicoccus suwonensis TaxID=657409 RepID=A0A561E722_9MICO|nr:beta-phosphoglucomutase family hydrolase [Rudaeicoccus suwonensis]TWE11425.1 HAD superfamily hydrolase (TIGR01509 family)/beta-phosphoglucomutase family hydrolase [Rudaeicoccus suwonensis]
MLGLPDTITTCLFDLDGVLTDTASVHRAAWKKTFDAYLKAKDGNDFQEFTDKDYNDFVDGKPRQDGVRDFLESRDIHLPDGDPDDPAEAATVWGLGNRKNEQVQHAIEHDGVTVYDGSRRYLQAAQEAGLRRFVVSSSANTEKVLEVTGLATYIEGRVDGVTLTQQHLKGKPAPDSFLAGARLAGVSPSQAVVFEDATSGVAAGRAGHFGYVVGVDRVDHAKDLMDHGADIVVRDLADLLAPRKSNDGNA